MKRRFHDICPDDICQVTFGRRHLPGDICPEGRLPRWHLPRNKFARKDIFPEDICPEGVCPEGHLPRRTFAQKDVCPERHLPFVRTSLCTYHAAAQAMRPGPPNCSSALLTPPASCPPAHGTRAAAAKTRSREERSSFHPI
jgi:hypothetical protein